MGLNLRDSHEQWHFKSEHCAWQILLWYGVDSIHTYHSRGHRYIQGAQHESLLQSKIVPNSNQNIPRTSHDLKTTILFLKCINVSH